MPAVVIVILTLAFVLVVCAVGVETLRRYNRPSAQPPAPSVVEVQSWAIVRAFGNDSQSIEIANIWMKLSETAREELVFYGRGLMSSVLPAALAPTESGVSTLVPVFVNVEADRQSSRPTTILEDQRATVAMPAPTFCSICERMIERNETFAADGHGVVWHSRCLSQVSANKAKIGAQR
jgi:hypothetical protein